MPALHECEAGILFLFWLFYVPSCSLFVPTLPVRHARPAGYRGQRADLPIA